MCDHLVESNVRQNLNGVLIYKDECMHCFITSNDDEGVNVCLQCYEGYCPSKHGDLHSSKCNHPIYVNIKQIPKVVEGQQEEITELKIGGKGGAKVEPEYDTVATLGCYTCKKELDRTANSWIPSVIDSVVISKSAYFSNQVEEWKQEINECPHTKELDQSSASKIASKSLAHCNDCDLKSNLWLCLTCGNLGCGRQMYDGSGGNGHGLNHYDQTKHPVSCKLGTIEPDGSASLYCYQCDEDVKDAKLGEHLSNLGIVIGEQVKTEKSIAEANLELNLNFTLSKIVEEGKILEPRFGPGYTGLDNIGNSCYMNSVVQVLLSNESVRKPYLEMYETHMMLCQKRPADCYDCQITKLVHGLYSGLYSHKKVAKPQPFEGMSEEEKNKEIEYQDGIRPRMFKNLIGKGHPEFQSGRQQDAQEYWDHLRTTMEKGERAAKRPSPFGIYDFEMQERLQCTDCKGVRYNKTKQNQLNLILLPEEGMEIESVELANCLERFFADVELDLGCSGCKKQTKFTKQTRFLNFPQVLMMTMQRFTFVDWVPKKVSTSLASDEQIDLEQFKVGEGLQEGEQALPEDEGVEVEVEPEFNQEILNQVIMMGIPELGAKHALLETGGSNAELAVGWYFENMGNPIIEQPIQKIKKVVKQGGADAKDDGPAVSADNVMMLSSMGFPEERCRKVLKKCNNDMERAADYIMSHAEEDDEEEGVEVGKWEPCLKPGKYQLSGLITHLGASIHAGHYVAHLKKENEWVLYNDEKVAHSIDAPIDKAFIYYWNKQ